MEKYIWGVLVWNCGRCYGFCVGFLLATMNFYTLIFNTTFKKTPLIALFECKAFSLLCLLKWEPLTGSLASTVPWRSRLSLSGCSDIAEILSVVQLLP